MIWLLVNPRVDALLGTAHAIGRTLHGEGQYNERSVYRSPFRPSLQAGMNMRSRLSAILLLVMTGVVVSSLVHGKSPRPIVKRLDKEPVAEA